MDRKAGQDYIHTLSDFGKIDIWPCSLRLVGKTAGSARTQARKATRSLEKFSHNACCLLLAPHGTNATDLPWLPIKFLQN